MLLDNTGRIKLADYSLGKRLADVCGAARDVTSHGVRFQDDDTLPTLGRGGKKADVFRLVRHSNHQHFCLR